MRYYVGSVPVPCSTWHAECGVGTLGPPLNGQEQTGCGILSPKEESPEVANRAGCGVCVLF